MSSASSNRLRVLLFLLAAAGTYLLSAPPFWAQGKLSFRIEDEVTRFALSADGRVAYSVRHVFSEKKVQLQRDDIWIAERDGKKRRILQGDKFVHGAGPFSYLVRGLRWSPDSAKLAIDLSTSEMINEDGDTREGAMTLLLDDGGKEIPIAGGDSVLLGAMNAAWLADSATIVYLTSTQSETRTPDPSQPAKETSFTLNRVHLGTGHGTPIFSGHKFAALSWNEQQSSAVAIERGPTGAATLVALDLIAETSRDLASLNGYTGGLSIAPSGGVAAYWVSNEQLEVREIGSPNRAARVRVVVGTIAWAGDETRIIVKQGAATRSGSLVWISLPPPAPVAAGTTPSTQDVALKPILHDLEFRQFDVSPDGKSLAVVEPGRRNLLLYSLP